MSYGPGSFRPWVVSPVSRFARESFRPGSFHPGSFRPWVVSPLFGESFRPYFSTMPVFWVYVLKEVVAMKIISFRILDISAKIILNRKYNQPA